MTLTQIITIFGFTLSALVALIIAHLHRRQMRQVELYKQDPSVGLVPKPSRLTTFVMSKWDSILGFGGPVLILISEFSRNAPISRLTIFNISVSLVLLVANFVLVLVFRLQKRTNERFEAILAIQERHLAVTDKLVAEVLDDNIRSQVHL